MSSFISVLVWTAKTAGPVTNNRVASAAGTAARAAAKALSSADSADSCFSMSNPAAFVCTTINARPPSRENQTPSRDAGRLLPANSSVRARIAPVGSAGRLCLTMPPRSELKSRRSARSA
jgi:hypothetical protein